MTQANKIYLAAGCFWGVQAYLDQIPGVNSTRVGYMGGETENPSYKDVCCGSTGHAETVEVTFDAQKLELELLLRHFFRLHDPTQFNRQGPDVGDQYRSEIFYTLEMQRRVAERQRAKIQKLISKPVVTKIEPASMFWPAEEYHQKYFEKTGRGFCHAAYEKIS